MSKLLTPPVWYNENGNLVTAPESSTDVTGLAIGHNATASNGSTAIGISAGSETNSSCVVVGASAKASGINSVVIGAGAHNTSGNNVVIGTSSYTDGDGVSGSTNSSGSVVVGYNSNVNGWKSVVIGSDCSLYGNGSICIGYGIKIGATGRPVDGRIQIGDTTLSYGDIYFGKNTIFDLIYPVGSIYMSVSSTDPGTLFGGTWERWGQGRVPVGVSDTDDDFGAGKTGGSKAASLPYHSHGMFSGSRGPSGVDGFVGGDASSLQPQNPSGSGADGFLFTISRTDSRYNSAYTAETASAGSANTSKSNLQPYITCYMWKRIE